MEMPRLEAAALLGCGGMPGRMFRCDRAETALCLGAKFFLKKSGKTDPRNGCSERRPPKIFLSKSSEPRHSAEGDRIVGMGFLVESHQENRYDERRQSVWWA
jgi:hypothetical protein